LQTIVCGQDADSTVYFSTIIKEYEILKPDVAFGKVIRRFRKSKKYSQERLAYESGLDRTFISLLERGLRQPSLTSILELSKALNISSVEIISAVEALLNENPTN